MASNLSSLASIQNNLFVRIYVEEYKATSASSYTTETLLFSDATFPQVINSETYTPLGRLLGITSTSSELRISDYEVTITLSGIPNSSIFEIVNSKIKGCPVEIYRGVYDTTTGSLVTGIGDNPMLRFKGMINNYSLNEEFDSNERSGTNTLVITCTSDVTILSNKIAGRKTNPDSEKKFFPDDVSFDRVPNLKNTTFDFGKE